MQNIADRFPNAKGFASEANALRKLAQCAGGIDPEALTAVVRRPADGRWLPIVIYTARATTGVNVGLAHAGICITN